MVSPKHIYIYTHTVNGRFEKYGFYLIEFRFIGNGENNDDRETITFSRAIRKYNSR